MAQEELTSDVQFVDDFYFSALSNENEDKIYPISDSKYAEELQFQEALMSSVVSSQTTTNATASASVTPPPLFLIQSTAPPPGAGLTITEEVGESSHCFCEICADKKETDDMLRIDSCSHSFCSDCITKHVATKIQESATVVLCPGWDCRGVLEFEEFGTKVLPEVAARWDERLCESLIPASDKFYCPFKDCSAMLVKDSDEGEGIITASECPICHRLFCASCYVTWHAGIDCEEFQRLNEDERGREDLMVRELAKSKSWKRCPHCKFYVEKTEGCLHISCRCGFQFCYACGATWSQYHGGCQP